MGVVVIRPDDLRRLARRFDALADDVRRSRRRLLSETASVRLNSDDPELDAGEMARRLDGLGDRLGRAVGDLQWDATVMGQSADDGSAVDDDWPAAVSRLGVGWDAVAGESKWETVANDLEAFGPGPGRPAEAVPAFREVELSGSGGLFGLASRTPDHEAGHVLGFLVGLGLGESPGGSQADPDWPNVWEQISRRVEAEPSDQPATETGPS